MSLESRRSIEHIVPSVLNCRRQIVRATAAHADTSPRSGRASDGQTSEDYLLFLRRRASYDNRVCTIAKAQRSNRVDSRFTALFTHDWTDRRSIDRMWSR